MEDVNDFGRPIWTAFSDQSLITYGSYALICAGLVFLFFILPSMRQRRAAADELRRSQARLNRLVTDVPDVDDPLAIPEPVLRRAAPPMDGACFKAICDFAKSKAETGEPLTPEERFADVDLALAARLLGPGGLAHMDTFEDSPPMRGWELRQMMERIDLPQIGAVFEEAMGVYLHRLQLITDMTASGMPVEQARAHPDQPSYAPLDAKLRDLGGTGAFTKAADRYFQRNYPWAE